MLTHLLESFKAEAIISVCLEMCENAVAVVRYTTQTRLGSNIQKDLRCVC